MKENGKMGKNTEKVQWNLPMETHIEEFGCMMRKQIKAFLVGLAAIDTRSDVHK